jgi:hypothetical protein
MRTEQDDASHGGVRREFIDEPLDRLIHPANLLPVTALGFELSTTSLGTSAAPSPRGY